MFIYQKIMKYLQKKKMNLIKRTKVKKKEIKIKEKPIKIIIDTDIRTDLDDGLELLYVLHN